MDIFKSPKAYVRNIGVTAIIKMLVLFVYKITASYIASFTGENGEYEIYKLLYIHSRTELCIIFKRYWKLKS